MIGIRKAEVNRRVLSLLVTALLRLERLKACLHLLHPRHCSLHLCKLGAIVCLCLLEPRLFPANPVLGLGDRCVDGSGANGNGPAGLRHGPQVSLKLKRDTGVAFELQRNLRPMTQTGGTIAIRTGTINTSISQTEDRIGREESRLEQAEADYRAQFAQMEAAMARMEQMQTRLQALQPQQRGNQ